MSYPIKSIFEQISIEVFKITDLGKAKEYVVNFVSTKQINDKDKQSILKETNNAKSLYKLQQYICNALLKYEGLSLNKHTTEKAIDNYLSE